MGFEFYITPEEYEIAEKNGISNKYLEQRIRRLGWHKEQAINTPIYNRKSKGHWGKVAVSNGIKYNTFVKRVNYYGWSLEKAATEPLVKPTGVKRKYPKELLELAQNNGISYLTFLKRVSKGTSPYEAASTPLISRSEAGKRGKASKLRKYGDRIYEIKSK